MQGYSVCVVARDVTYTNFWGVAEVAQRIFLSDAFFSNSSSPMVLCPVNCPPEVHCTTVFALLNGRFSRLGGRVSHPHTPLKLRPWLGYKAVQLVIAVAFHKIRNL